MAVTPAPFTILVLGRFCPIPDGYDPKPLAVDIASLGEAAAAMGPRFAVEVPKDACPAGELTVAVDSLAGFKPQNLAENVPYLRALRDAAAFVADATASGTGADQIAAKIRSDWPEIPLDLSLAGAAATPAPAANAGAIDDILSMVASSGQAARASGGAGPKVWKDQLETMSARLLAAVYANPDFRAYEAAWLGLEIMAKQAGIKQGGKVRLLICPVSEETLADTLSALAAKLILDLPDLTLVDVALDNTPARIALLDAALGFADTLLAPTVCYVTERFFNIDAWPKLSKIAYLGHAFEDASYAKWRKLREHPGAPRLCLMLNRFLARAPYGPDNRPKGVYFQEADGIYVSPVYALGALAAGSVGAVGWPTRFTDYATLAIRELPMDPVTGLAVEAKLSDDRIHECVEMGLTPLVGPVGKDMAIVPKEAALDGGSFAFQMFFARIIAALIALKENTPEGADPAEATSAMLTALFAATGQTPPEDLAVKTGRSQDGRIGLRISFTPPRAVLRADKLTFDFGW